ncbi:MAG TPA: excisionase, partial [Microbacterium sp.]|nr:excisionase [Microbacterium sp.]
AATRYPWLLLGGAALVSITANITHALVAADETVPGIVAALVASVPPIVLLAATHLTVELGRYRRAMPTVGEDADVDPATTLVQEGRSERMPVQALMSGTVRTAVAAENTHAASSTPSRARADMGRPEDAIRLSMQGLSNRQIALELGVHPTTVGRWMKSVAKRSETTAEKEES